MTRLIQPGGNQLSAPVRRRGWALLGLLSGLVVLMMVAGGIGPVSIGPGEIVAILFQKAGIHLPVGIEERNAVVFWQIRLPRVLLGVLVGGGLGLAGAAMQAWFRNPLADPGLLGVSAGGMTGAVATIVLAQGLVLTAWLGRWLLPAAAFGGALLAVSIVMRLARDANGRTNPATMLLAGIAVNAMLGAATGLIIYLADDAQLRSLTFWSMGSLGGASWPLIAVATLCIGMGLALLWRTGHALNLLALGARDAEALGLNVKGLGRRLIAASSVAAGATVAFAGMIGFIGLVAPHLVRLAFGADHRMVLPGAGLLGAILVVSADLLARNVAAPAEVPIGILTSILGAPFFLWLLNRRRLAEGR